MLIKCPHCTGAVELTEAAIMSAAARIQNRRRKTHGGAPLKTFPCPWCNQACQGRAGLRLHVRHCDKSLAALLGVEAFSE